MGIGCCDLFDMYFIIQMHMDTYSYWGLDIKKENINKVKPATVCTCSKLELRFLFVPSLSLLCLLIDWLMFNINLAVFELFS